jgi:hypothetical protein
MFMFDIICFIELHALVARRAHARRTLGHGAVSLEALRGEGFWDKQPVNGEGLDTISLEEILDA